MRVLGIDPGIERVGYGLVDIEGSRVSVVAYGLIQTPRVAIAERLLQVYEQVDELIATHEPRALAIERLLFTANKTTAMDVSRSIGVMLLAGARRGLDAVEYSPPEVKLAVVGYGSASKEQVQFMVCKLLSLAKAPKPDDVTDALAIALTHAFRCKSNVEL